MPNAIVDAYRKYLADSGQQDSSTDYDITAAIGQWAQQNNPGLFQSYPDFGQEYGEIRDANAPSLLGETGRALKSGAQGLAATGLGALALPTDSDYLKDKARSFEEDAAANAPTIPTMEDIAPGRRGIGRLFSKDTARYVASKVGGAIPSLAEGVGLAVAGGALGSAAGPEGTLAGAGEGAIEGFLGKGIVKTAIKRLLAARGEELVAANLIPDATEAAVANAIRDGSQDMLGAVTKEATAISARRGLAAANALNMTALNAGALANEGADTKTALLGGIAGAIPAMVVPELVGAKLYPGVAKAVGQKLGAEYVTRLATEAVKDAGVLGTAMALQETANIISKNIAAGRDPTEISDADWKRIREAGVGGALTGPVLAPITARGTREAFSQQPRIGPPAAPAGEPLPPPSPAAPDELRPVGDAMRQAQEQQAADQASGLAAGVAMAGPSEGGTGAPELPGEPPSVASASLPAAAPSNLQLGAAMAGNIPDEALPPLAAQSTPTAAEITGENIPAQTTEPQKNFLPNPAISAEDLKAQQVRAAASIPGVTFQYTVFRPGEGIPDAIQVDVISPDRSESLASTNPTELRALGVDIPDVPANLPQGRYTIEQIRAATTSPKSPVLPLVQSAETAPAAQVEPAASAGEGGTAPGVAGEGNVPLETTGGKGKRFAFGSRPDGTTDIIDAIQEVGGVPRKPLGATGGEWDGQPETFKGSARILLRPKSSTQVGMDQFLGDLVSTYPEFAHLEGDTNAFYDAVNKALAERSKLKTAVGAEQSQGKFMAALQGEGRAESKGGKPVSVDELSVGAKFKAKREPVEVVAVNPGDNSVTLKDGPRYGEITVPAGTEIRPDKFSLRKGQQSADFIPPEDIPAHPDATVPKAETPPAPVPFSAGKVIEGQPSVDFRNAPTAAQLTPDQWAQAIQENLLQGNRGSHDSSKSDTRIGVALQAPDGRVILTGAIVPSRTLDATGRTAVKEVTLQRMGVDEAGVRKVQASGNRPSLVRDVVSAGYKPIAILHFDGEPGRIHEVFPDQQAFDRSWNQTEKTQGPNIRPPEIRGEPVANAHTEAQLESKIEQLGEQYLKANDADRESIRQEILDLYRQLENVAKKNQNLTGDQSLPPEYRRTGPSAFAVESGRNSTFQRAMASLQQLGLRVDLFSREILAQNSEQEIQRRIAAVQQDMSQATNPAIKAELARRLAVLQERAQSAKEAAGVTYSPWHIALAMDDIGNASTNNLVTLLHEAAESLTMRLPIDQRGAVRTAIDSTMDTIRARAAAASEKTGVPLARETGAHDLLAETLAQELTAQGVPDAPSLAQSIVRWIKDVYYRTAMAMQRAFGAEPDPSMALDWFENQLRREVSGDYSYEFGNLISRYVKPPVQEQVRQFTGRTATPGGIADFFDPVSAQLRQPQVDTLNRDALNWNLEYQLPGHPGKDLDIPDPEARARIKGGVLNGLNKFYVELKDEIAPDQDWNEFFAAIKRPAEEDPKLLLAALNEKFPASGEAEIGGDRMTEAMNREAQVELWSRFRKLSLSMRRQVAQAKASIAAATKQMAERAASVNKLEADVKNAALHEDTLREKAKGLVREVAQAVVRGRNTAHLQGSLAEAIRQAEGLRDDDAIPGAYRDVLKRVYDGETPIFDYIRAIAELDLPLNEMTTKEVMAAMKAGADHSPPLANLLDNKPLSVVLATLARKNADQVDQIQLGWLRDTSKFREIHGQLEEIKTATTSGLKDLDKQFSEQKKAVGLAARLKASYFAKRRQQQATSDRIQRNEERQNLLEKAIDPVDKITDETAQSAGGAQYEWAPEENAAWTAIRQDDEGVWRRTTRILHFNADGSAVDSEQLRKDIASNLDWLKQRADDAGKPKYNQIAAQTYALKMLDARGQQQRTWHNGILNGIDRFVRTPIATARTLGGPSMQRIIQMLHKYQFILRNYTRNLEAPSVEWQHEFIRTRDSSGLKDNAEFINQVYKPALYFLSVNPGLEEGPAIRKAISLVRDGLKNPAENFNDRMAGFLRKTKDAEGKLLGNAENFGVFVEDKRLGGELRRAVPKGYLTGMRSLNGGLVQVLNKDMLNAGWKMAYDTKIVDGKEVKTNMRPATFSFLDPANAADPEERAALFENLGDTQALGGLIERLFTPTIVGQWLEPFIAKPGQEPFAYAGEPIPQSLVQEAWGEAGGNVLKWIDALGEKVGVKTDKGGNDPVALFRLSMLRNLDQLFGHEAKLAADASQTPGLLDPHGPKPHALMDARVSDLLPPEHVDFATYEPESMHRLMARVAYHGAFGRNATAIQGAFREMMNHLRGRQSQFETLASLHSSKAGRVAEAAARGWNYDELAAASKRYQAAKDFQDQLNAVLGVSQNSGPLGDFHKGMTMLNFVVGQIVDNPKTAAYNLISPAMRPLAQRSLGPTSIANTAKVYADILQTGLGSLFQSFGLHLFKATKYADTIGNSEGRAFSNLPYGVVLSDIGHSGDAQEGLNKWMVKPLKIARQLQRKGVQAGAGEAGEFPRLSLIPGLGVINSISNIEVQAGGARLAQEFEQVVKNGMDYLAAHPDAANDPSFRFKASDIYKHKLDHELFNWWRQKASEYNLGNLEDISRDAAQRQVNDPSTRLLTDDQALQVSMMNQNEFSGNSSINTTPAWLMTNPFLRMTMPLLRWPMWMMSAVHEAAKPREGENAVKPFLRAMGTLALWNLPLGIAFSFLMDEYDKKLVGRKSNLPELPGVTGLPLVGIPLALLQSKHPLTDMEAMLVRSARAGNIYGLGGDVAAQTFAGLDPSTGQRSISLDQRVLVMSQLLNVIQSVKAWAQGGEATYGSVAKPLLMSIGGNGALHAVDMANHLLGLDNAESRLVQRTASSNWIRSAAQELDMDIKQGSGFASPTPLSTQTRQMYLAALANDRGDFLEGYRKALNAARETVANDPDIRGADREKEAVNRVLSSWRSRAPMSVLATKPTDLQIQRMLSIMDPQGQQSVRDAISRYDAFTSMITPSPIERYFERQLTAQSSQYDPQALQRRMAGSSLLFSTH